MSMKRLLPAMMLASAGIGFSPIHAQLVVDYLFTLPQGPSTVKPMSAVVSSLPTTLMVRLRL